MSWKGPSGRGVNSASQAPPQHVYRLRPPCEEVTDERRLADTGFAADEDDTTAVLPDQ
jgi:hypothetical protein